MSKPPVVAIIGSSKFKPQQMGTAQALTLKGKIVLLPGLWHHVDHVPITEVQKHQLDELMLRKIEIADEVYVVDVNGYIGESTMRGIEHAKSLAKPVEYMAEPVFPAHWVK